MRLRVAFDQQVAEDLSAGDLAIAEQLGWAWPLIRCPRCGSITGRNKDNKSVLDKHFFNFGGHWKQCSASMAIIELAFDSVSPSPESKETPSPPVQADGAKPKSKKQLKTERWRRHQAELKRRTQPPREPA